ncbi:MAG: hypothetical protein HY905_26110 [Deltaproteobacteria bacterium]|nr:hypothetical protein [Deltaproteobacteria bacterium]
MLVREWTLSGWSALLVLALGCGDAGGLLEIRVSAEPADLAFDRVRVEVAGDGGVGTWERELSGAGSATIDAGPASSGTVRVWGIRGAPESPQVVAFGEGARTAGEGRVEVTVRAASDGDGDWVVDAADDCPARVNFRQVDSDGDAVGDACDTCPAVADPEQRDTDGNGVGDACEPHDCGNGAREAGEACDDGNTAAGDGCSADCRTEACGNGSIDPGEACDDGNTADRDGCDSDCRHTPVIVAAELPVLGDPHLADFGSGDLVAAWFSAADLVDPDRGDIRLQRIDRATGAAGPGAAFGRGTAVTPFHLRRGGSPAALTVAWTDVLDGTMPAVRHARVRVATIPADLSSAAGVVDLADVEEGLARGWGTFGGDRGLAFAFAAPPEDPSTGRWLDGTAWPPVLGEPVGASAYVNTEFVAGASRDRGGWLAAWAGVRPDSTGLRTSIWARRFDESGAVADPDDAWLADVAGFDQLEAVYEPAEDVYLVGVLNSSGASHWSRLAPGGGSPDALVGATLPYGVSLVATGDGTVLAGWVRLESGGCVLHVQGLDGYGRAVGAERAWPLGGLAGLVSCRGSVSPLADDRVIVNWVRVVGVAPDASWSVGWWFVASAGDLL